MLAHALILVLAATNVAAPKRPDAATQVRAKQSSTFDAGLAEVLAQLGDSPNLTKSERARLQKMIFVLPEVGDEVVVAAVPADWEPFVKSWSTRTKVRDPNRLVQFVLRQAYLDSNEELRGLADKVAFYNQQKRKLRDEIARVRTRAAKLEPGETTKVRSVKVPAAYAPGAAPVVFGKPVLRDRAAIEAMVATWEDKLQTAGEDGQLANVDLQNGLQRMQQTLQTMSNVSKLLHDTAMNTIRKIG